LLGGTDVAIGARAIDPLAALVDRRERLVPKAELIELASPGLVVDESKLQLPISALRKLLGAGAIPTVPGRGYRFTLAVEAPASGPDAAASARARRGVAPAGTAAEQPAARPRPVDRRDAATSRSWRSATCCGSSVWSPWRAAAAWASRVWRARSGGAKSVASPTASGGLTWARCHAATASRRRSRRPAACHWATATARCCCAGCLRFSAACWCSTTASTGALLQPVLDRAAGVRLLVTSQVALHLPGKQVSWLDGLCVPPDGASLVQARACSALAHFEQRAVACD